MHLLMLLFTSLYFSDPSGSNFFFLSSLLLSHRSRISAVTQGFFLWSYWLFQSLLCWRWWSLSLCLYLYWTEYCSELYIHKANGNPSVLNYTRTHTHRGRPTHPSQRSGGCSTIIEEREVSWSRQHPNRTGPSRWRGYNQRSPTICNKIWQTGEW